jgi:hypothetical protein
MTAAVATDKLTRAEAAYAHLASFQRGDKVDVGGRSWFQPGIVTTAQQDGGSIEGAYLMVEGCGVQTKVTVASLLSGKFTITSLAGARDGGTRYFDEAGYAMQNEAA